MSKPSNDIASEIEQLAGLYQRGILSKAEFEDAKRRVIGQAPTQATSTPVADAIPVPDTAISLHVDETPAETVIPARPNKSRANYAAIGFGVVSVVAAGIWLAVSSFGAASEPQSPVAKTPEQPPPPLAKEVGTTVVAEPASIRPPEPITAPTINVGDKYSYKTTATDANGKVTIFESTREVTAVDGGRVTVSVTNEKSSKARTLVYDLSWNIVETGDGPDAGMRYDPPIKYFDFPLTTGKKWTARSTETDKKTGKTRQHIINGEVIGWDANIGRFENQFFDALKIRLETEVSDGEKRSTGTDISWYAPVIGRTVKSDISGQDADGRQDKKTVAITTVALPDGPKHGIPHAGDSGADHIPNQDGFCNGSLLLDDYSPTVIKDGGQGLADFFIRLSTKCPNDRNGLAGVVVAGDWYIVMTNIVCYKDDPSKKGWQALTMWDRNTKKAIAVGCGSFGDNKLKTHLIHENGTDMGLSHFKLSDIQKIIPLDYVGKSKGSGLNGQGAMAIP
jgi:hypothetical protein